MPANETRPSAPTPKEAPPHHEAGARLVLRGVLANVVLAAVKIVAGLLGHTYALVADGIESLVDVVSSLLVWTGFRVSVRPPDAGHPYGHGKAEALVALAVAAFILAMAGWIGYRAVQEILTPHHAPAWWTLLVLAGVVGVKLLFSRRLRRLGEAAGSTALTAEALHHGSDAATSAAAFVGIVVALLGGPGWEAADDWAALFACLIIGFNGFGMALRALGEVMDAALPAGFEREVRALALAVPGVLALDKVRMRKSGLNHFVDIQIRVNGDLSVREGHTIAHAVKDALMTSADHRITDVTVHVEPLL